MIQKLSKLTFFITALLTLSLSTVPVYAEHGSGDVAGSSDSTSSSTATSTTTETETGTHKGKPEVSTETHAKSSVSTEAKADHATTAADRQLKQCQNREKTIKSILGHISDRGQKQVDLFSTVSTRVETFATTKNQKPANYDALVSAVDAQKASAQATVDSIKADATNFTCDSTTPKGASASFKADLQKEIAALKAYRTAVKNLIVGVKSVAGSTDKTDSSKTTTTTTTGGSN